jgi:hypothetical protein
VNLAHVEPIADAILYEGYLLYPYRSSALKNQERWTFGILHAPEDSAASGGLDPGRLQTECLLVATPDAEVELAVRFLHPARREVQRTSEGGFEPVESVSVGERRLEPGQEAAPVRIDAGPISLAELAREGLRRPFVSEAGRRTESVRDESGRVAALVIREHERLEGLLEATATPLAGGTYKLTVQVSNVTPARPGTLSERRGSVLRSLVSAHVVLGTRGGEFVSLLDPPMSLRAEAEACRNVGVWPVLVGTSGRRDTVLCSPIILDDFPAIAPESPGLSFDGLEIDEILTLRILTLTPDERRMMAAADDRARSLLERTENLGPEARARLHGALRRGPDVERPRTLEVDGVHLGAGDAVRLRPRGRRDIFDLALAGRRATILSAEQDYDGRAYFTVTVDDDPGRDLGAEGKPGHRFFFDPDEVEPWPGGGA